MVIREALEYGKKNLSNNLYTDPLSESRNLLSFLLNKDMSFVFINMDYELDEEIKNKFISIIDKRKEGYPLEYILNIKNFYGRDFYVDYGSLIPRWDTENLIEVVKDISKEFYSPEILEIGAGSGAISITMGLEIENASVLGIDISEDALSVANRNLEKYKLENLSFKKSDLFSNVKNKYDIIVSNPPYIKKTDLEFLQDEVKKEPMLALDGGLDGLDFYREISKKAKGFLKEKAYLVFEIGHDQFEDVRDILIENGFIDIKFKKDLQDYIRVIWGLKEENICTKI